jgi:hypothetical protein
MSLKRLLVSVAVLTLLLAPAGTALAQPTEEEIEASVAAGLAWLATQQIDDGGFAPRYYCDRVAYTGLVVTKFADRALDLHMSPTDPDYEYADLVTGGLEYIMSQQIPIAIGVEPAGDPDGDGDGLGVYFTDCGYHEIYNTGVAMMALAASGDPGTFGGALQDAVDFMAWAQADPECGLHRGGWRYYFDYCTSDNSNSGYATLGLGFAEAAPPFGFGLVVPQFVKDELDIWIDVMQDDVDGDTWDGGSWYDPGSHWVNILKTGNLIYEMGLVGDTAATPRVQDAVDFIERHWFDNGGCDVGWIHHRQAMFTMMKGLEAMGIEYLDLDGDGVAEHDWFAEVAQHLIDTQQGDGSWPWDCWGNQLLSTTWALLTLEKAVPTFAIEVAFDAKPGSCPNPFNIDKKGVFPAAILGTADFDVTQIDPASVTLAGVSPLRWALDDVATPFEPFLGKQDASECNELGPDGFFDLTFRFNGPELAAALGEVNDGDAIVLPLEGNLMEEYGGTPIVGEDVVIILEK